MAELKWINGAILDEVVPKRKGACEFRIPDAHNDLIFTAKLAEQAERYDEMVLCMKKVVKLNSELNVDERNLLALAYKNVLSSRRTAWRVVVATEAANAEEGSTVALPLIAMLRQQLESELAAVCEDFFQLLEQYLIPAAQGGEAKVFYLKLKGDYHRYYAEVITSDAQKRAATDAYEKATQIANSSLPPTHPTRLGLALNVSVFHYEILKQRDIGFQLAQSAYDEAAPEVDQLEPEAAREAAVTVQMLRDNLDMWRSERV
jgi:14-3-3 protein epsilon